MSIHLCSGRHCGKEQFKQKNKGTLENKKHFIQTRPPISQAGRRLPRWDHFAPALTY
ncbi:hypothetical protein Q9966_010691 [Columba livia]|nr:hypothetical protein Q9966_010691 [Columba livia]KAK2526861.1 hypothetical protein Q9966_010691 [Columba livia]